MSVVSRRCSVRSVANAWASQCRQSLEDRFQRFFSLKSASHKKKKKKSEYNLSVTVQLVIRLSSQRVINRSMVLPSLCIVLVTCCSKSASRQDLMKHFTLDFYFSGLFTWMLKLPVSKGIPVNKEISPRNIHLVSLWHDKITIKSPIPF